ncbi:MAG: type III pantothenate kinase [Muribaculaceae bacterium]|nr:type III pantothenate kinase [Muribaculaceae bacterium]
MTRHLCIDCGNTRIKAAVFEGEKLVASVVTDYDDLTPLVAMARRARPQAALMASTSHGSAQVTEVLGGELPCKLQELDHTTPMPLDIAYRTPSTLGRDRMATAVGAWAEYPGCNLLVVDAGTCITLDVVLASGSLLGGNIAPGVTMRLQAMHEHTSRLPLVELDGDVPLVAYDTTTALRSGAVLGAAAQIDLMAAQLKGTLGQLKVMLTGGDAQLLAQHLVTDSVDVVDDLLLRGMNTIIMYNEL